jgi:hypothetical protein
MVEIEIGVLATQCLDRRIESIQALVAETAIWEQRRNAAGNRVKWMFPTEKARPRWAKPIHGLRLTQITPKDSKPLYSGTSPASEFGQKSELAN